LLLLLLDDDTVIFVWLTRVRLVIFCGLVSCVTSWLMDQPQRESGCQ